MMYHAAILWEISLFFLFDFLVGGFSFSLYVAKLKNVLKALVSLLVVVFLLLLLFLHPP